MDRAGSIDFLRKGFIEMGYRVREDDLEEAVDNLDGVIGWLTYYGYYTLKYGHREALNRTVNDGSEIVEEEIMHFLSNRLQARENYLLLLRILEKPCTWSEAKKSLELLIGRRLHPNQFTRYIRELVNYGFIVKENNVYKHTDPLIRYAIKKIKH